MRVESRKKIGSYCSCWWNSLEKKEGLTEDGSTENDTRILREKICFFVCVYQSFDFGSSFKITMVQKWKKKPQQKYLSNHSLFYKLGSKWASEQMSAVERASKASSVEQAYECALCCTSVQASGPVLTSGLLAVLDHREMWNEVEQSLEKQQTWHERGHDQDEGDDRCHYLVFCNQKTKWYLMTQQTNRIIQRL